MTMGRRGFALIVVLWILVSVGATSIALHTASSYERRVVSNVKASSEARWAARAGLAHFIYQLNQLLSRRGGGAIFAAVGDTMLPPLQFKYNGFDVRIVMRDPRGRINLNKAGEPQLRRFFVALGTTETRAVSLTHAILDWRDADDLRRPQGAERDDYLRARGTSGPKNAPFDNVDELLEVYGVDTELFRDAVDYVTVFGDGRINVNSAAVPVLASIPDVDVRLAKRMVARRAAARYRSPLDVLQLFPRTTRDAASSQTDRLAAGLAFTAGDAEILVTARRLGSSVGTTQRVFLEMGGGSQWRVARIVDR